MFEWFYSWSKQQIFDLIDEVDEERKEKKIKNQVVKTSFAEDLKDRIEGIKVISEVQKV